MSVADADIETDCVVVGAGSAGCVVASRLAAAGIRTLLLEAGPRDNSWLVQIPAGALKLRGHPVFDWRFLTEPSAGAAGRIFHWPRGRVLGGSSSINGMNFVRGVAADFDYWAQSGCQGWSFDDVRPHFRAIEHYDGGADIERGRDGPIRVKDYDTILPLTHTFVRAAEQAGYRIFNDINDRSGEGVGYSQMSRTGRFRASSARFLAEPAARANLKVETGAAAAGLIFEGRRCVGVKFRQSGRIRVARARQQVIVAAGAIGSPHLLQVSGIGPADFLQSIGVDVVHESARGRRQPVGPLRRNGRLAHQGHSHTQSNRPRPPLPDGGRAVDHCRNRSADIRRHDSVGVLPQPRGSGSSGHPAPFPARQLPSSCRRVPSPARAARAGTGNACFGLLPAPPESRNHQSPLTRYDSPTGDQSRLPRAARGHRSHHFRYPHHPAHLFPDGAVPIHRAGNTPWFRGAG